MDTEPERHLLFARQSQRNTRGLDQAAENRNETKKDEKAAWGQWGPLIPTLRRILNPVQPGDYHKFQVNLDS